MPAMIGAGCLKRAARSSARSCVLSPISASAITASEMSIGSSIYGDGVIGLRRTMRARGALKLHAPEHETGDRAHDQHDEAPEARRVDDRASGVDAARDG